MRILPAFLILLPAMAMAEIWPWDQPLPNGMGVRVNDAGLARFEPMMEDMITVEIVREAIMVANPIFDEGDSFASARVDVTDLTFAQPVEITLDSTSGSLSFLANLHDLVIDVDAEGTAVWIPWSSDGQIWADRTEMTASVQVTVTEPDHLLDVQIVNTNVDVHGFGFDIDGFPDFLEDLFIEDIQTMLEETIEEQVPAQVEPAMEDLLNSLFQEYDLELLGLVIHVSAYPQDVLFNSSGLSIWLDSDVYGDERSDCVPTLSGSEYTATTRPIYWSNIPGTQIPFEFGVALGENLLNRILFTAFDTGFLCLSLDSATLEELGVPIPMTSALFEAAVPRIADYCQSAPAILEIRPQQPLTARLLPPEDEFTATLAVQDLDMDVYFLLWERWVRFFTLRVDVTEATLDVEVDQEGLLALTLGDVVLTNQVVFDELMELTPEEETNLETVLPFVMEIILPLLADSLGGIEIPAIEGFELQVDALRNHGSQQSYLGAFGSLIPAPPEGQLHPGSVPELERAPAAPLGASR